MTPAEKLQEAAKLAHLSAEELAKAARQADPRQALHHAISARMHARDAQAYLAWVELDELARMARQAHEGAPDTQGHLSGGPKCLPGHPDANQGGAGR